MSIKSPCIICNSSSLTSTQQTVNVNNSNSNEGDSGAGSGTGTGPVHKIPNNDFPSASETLHHDEFVFRTFCSSFGIRLPLTHEILKGVIIEWNLQKESKPFCTSCERIAENLVELCLQLETVKHEIEVTKSRIRSEIIKSNKIMSKRNATVTAVVPTTVLDENEENVSITSNEPKRMKMSKGGKNGKATVGGTNDKVKILRELIVGPTLCIPRCSVILPESKETKKFSKRTSSSTRAPVPVPLVIYPKPYDILKRNAPPRKESFFKSAEPEQAENLVVSIDPFENSDCDFNWDADDDTVEDRSELPNQNQDQDQDQSGIRIYDRNPFCKSSEAEDQNQESLLNIANPHDEQPFPRSHTDYLDALEDSLEYPDSEASAASEDTKDDDYTVSSSEEEIKPKKRRYRVKSTARSKSKSKSKRIKQNESNQIRRTIRRTVKCEGDNDRYMYDDRFEFSGSELVGFRCTLCPTRKFSLRRLVTQHMRDVHIEDDGNRHLLCPICGKLLKSKTGLERHIETHDDKQVVCQICGDKFRSNTLLKFHTQRIHTKPEELRVVCEYCGKVFGNRNNANRHILSVHMKKKRHFCHQCGKGFFTASGVQFHMAVHSTEKPFGCDFCQQRFNRACHKVRHERQFHNYLKDDSNTAGTSNSSGVLQEKTKPNDAEPHLSRGQHDDPNSDNNNSESEPEDSTMAGGVAMNIPENPANADDGSKDSLKCKYCGIQYNRQNNLTRHLWQIHHINVKGVAWKCKYRPRPRQSQPPAAAKPGLTRQPPLMIPFPAPIPSPLSVLEQPELSPGPGPGSALQIASPPVSALSFGPPQVRPLDHSFLAAFPNFNPFSSHHSH